MDFLFSHSSQIPSSLKDSSNEIPSFDEAFDTDSLKRFFRYYDSMMNYSKYHHNPGMEEENASHGLELISPATTSLSNGFLDMLSLPSEDSDQGMVSRSQSGLTISLKNYQNPVHREMLGDTKGDLMQRVNREGSKGGLQPSQNPESQDLIAMLCQQIQQYYPEDHKEKAEGSGENQGNSFGNGPQKQMNKNRMMSWEEDRAEPTVLKRLISKQNIFTIQKDAKPASLNIQRKMSTQVTQVPLMAKRKASAPLLTIQRLSSDVGDLGEAAVPEIKPKQASKNVKKDKEEKGNTKSVFGNSVNINVGDMGEKKTEKATKSKKMVIGNLTVGVKNLATKNS